MPQHSQGSSLQLQDNQMFQRQLMLKQLQELQKHQQFPGSADARQQNYLNQHPENFMPANMSFVPHGASAAVQGFPNGIFSQPQTQDLFLTLPPDQLVESLSRTTMGNSINNYNQYSHLQGLAPESSIKVHNHQAEKPTMQSLYGTQFLGVNQNVSPDLHSFTDGTFQSEQFLNGNNLFAWGHNEGFQQMNTSAREFNSRQEQTGSYEQFQEKTTKIDLSQGSTTLDPLEQKILFNMDGSSWSSSFGSNTEGYTNTLECSDYLSSFPSIQSGSWSALMQSAVAESSSDNGMVQEEWSGLSFQNTELSMDNQPSINADVGNQLTDLADNNVASSLNGKPQAPFGGANMGPGFSVFQFPNRQREGIHSDTSHESVQPSLKVAAKWLDGNLQQGQSLEGSQSNHAIQPASGNAFPFQGFQHSDGNANQMSILAESHDQTFTPQRFGSNMQGNHNVTSAARSTYTRNQHQKQNLSDAAVENQSQQAASPNMANKFPPFDLFIPRVASNSSFSLDQVGQQFSILEAVSVESSRKPQSLGLNTSTQTHPSGTGLGELSSDWQLSSNPTNTDPQAPPWVSQAQHGPKKIEGLSSHESGADLKNQQGLFDGEDHDNMSTHQRAFSEFSQTTQQMGLYHGLESVAKHLPEETDGGGDKQVPSVSARDLEAFGRSLKPSNLHPNYSSSSEMTHELGSVSGPSTSQFVNPFAFQDTCMQSIKPSSLPLVNTAEEMSRQGLSLSRTDLNVNDMAFHRTGNAGVNMQMASWFKQYGAVRNGQMLSMYDKTTENYMHPSPLGIHSENLEVKTSSAPIDVSGDSQVAVKNSTPSTLPPDFVDADLSMTRSRKRKIATSNLLPWHTEVTESSKRLQSISMAEMEWAKAVNRLVDKVDYGVKMIEDLHPLLRPKKRLVLTTQLMQLVFMPAPAAVLRGKAASNYDSLTYFSAKLALGDACNLNSWSRNDSGFPCTGDKMMTESSKATEKPREKCFSTIVDNFTCRAKKLEANLMRFEKTASVLEVIVEYNELEKISIINRFAKFHIRGQPKAAEASASSVPIPNLLNPAPQRYVVALRAISVPEKAQCLAL